MDKNPSTETPDTAATLDSTISQQVRDLCQKGYALFDQRDYSAAIRLFFSAWTLLPKPQTQWEEAGWVLTALGDGYFAKGNFRSGKQSLLSALHCPNALGNPIIHLRLGQCLHELGEHEAAFEQLKRALSHGGKALFEQEDPKYLNLVAAP